MARRMLIDATHPEETRVVVVSGNRLEEFDYESLTRKQLKGNIYLAKITRVEPSLQAAFVDYGGNRHGFLPFSEIHPDYYRIPISDRRALLAEEARLSDDEEAAEETTSGSDSVGLSSEDQSDVTEPDEKTGGSGEESPQSSAVQDSPDDIAVSVQDGPEGDADEQTLAASTAASDLAGAANGAQEEAAPEQELPKADPLDGDEDFAEEPNGIAEVADAETVETVGGDEVDEEQRQRARLMRRYKIQEVIKQRQVILVQVAKEERGNKGAALTTYISLAGRYCVLMPNTAKGGGISRKISNAQDRRRLKKVLTELEIPEGMAVIVRTAGSQRTKLEIRRDYEYLLRLWNEVRETTLQSTAPELIYEEADLAKRVIRDLYSRDMDEILVEGEDHYKVAKGFMKTLMPSHARNVKLYKDPSIPLFHRYQIESQLDAMHNSTVQLKSGGYIVLNPTEALVAVDVNSGRATKERHIEETALKTNLEAAEEIARQLRLRDLAGLIVIDFIDMEEQRHNREVERKLKEAMRVDRARIQLGRISHFGLLEMSRQRLRPSLVESSTEPCTVCGGLGHVRSTDSSALHVLRAIEDEGIRQGDDQLTLQVPSPVALFILNQKRRRLLEIEARYGLSVEVLTDDSLIAPDFRLSRASGAAVGQTESLSEQAVAQDDSDSEGRSRRRRRRRKGAASSEAAGDKAEAAVTDESQPAEENEASGESQDQDQEPQRQRRRRGKRGGRKRTRRQKEGQSASAADAVADDSGEPALSQEADAEAVGQEQGASAQEVTEGTSGSAGKESVETTAAAKSDGKPRRPRRPRRSRARSKPTEPSGGTEQTEREPAVSSDDAQNDLESSMPEDSFPETGDNDASLPEPQEQAPPLAADAVDGAALSSPQDAEDEAEPTGPRRRGWWQRLMS